jgi:ribonucleoside-diphosphate reductase alpha chain
VTAPFDNPLSEWVWESRYRAPGEVCVEDTWRRVARTLAAGEPLAGLEARFYDAQSGFRFVPGGRVLAGAGVRGRGMLINCFVAHPASDADVTRMPEAVLTTLEQGGGVGADLSNVSAGRVVELLHVWDAAAADLSAQNARRGAMMATLHCDHPDLDGFIHAKDDPDVLTHFNLSVLIPEGGLGNRPGLLQKLAASAWSDGEPGLLFLDRVNEDNNLWYSERISAANPCGEVPLPPGGACVLGSINLSRLVARSEGRWAFDVESLDALVPVAVRMLDRVIDVTDFPTPEQAQAVRATRRLGLGVMGLGDVLALLGLTYGAPEAVAFTRAVMTRIRDAAYRASIALAGERGSFPSLDAGRFLDGGYARRLPEPIRQQIRDRGIRNSHLLSVAPTGTISLLAGNTSGGLEPIFSLEAERTVRSGAGGSRRVRLTDYAWRLAREAGGVGSTAFVTAAEVTPAGHLAIQAAVQEFVDNAIAKTINLPESATVQDVIEVFETAARLGLKGCTVFRAGGVRCPVVTPLA